MSSIRAAKNKAIASWNLAGRDGAECRKGFKGFRSIQNLVRSEIPESRSVLAERQGRTAGILRLSGTTQAKRSDHESDRIQFRYHKAQVITHKGLPEPRWPAIHDLQTGQCAEINWRRQREFDYLTKVTTGVKFLTVSKCLISIRTPLEPLINIRFASNCLNP